MQNQQIILTDEEAVAVAYAIQEYLDARGDVTADGEFFTLRRVLEKLDVVKQDNEAQVVDNVRTLGVNVTRASRAHGYEVGCDDNA